jgi:CPA1 family monovalent cation:H+ antiporter
LVLFFGSLISATDPISVITIFEELEVAKRLLIIVEGECLLNG